MSNMMSGREKGPPCKQSPFPPRPRGRTAGSWVFLRDLPLRSEASSPSFQRSQRTKLSCGVMPLRRENTSRLSQTQLSGGMAG